jgi:hypothetical protein
VSGTSPGQAAASEQAQWQAQMAKQLFGMSQPEMTAIMEKLTGTLGNVTETGQMTADASIKQAAENQLNKGYGQALFGNQEFINYAGLRSGEGRLSPGAMGSALQDTATRLDRERASAMRTLQFQSAQSSMADYNQVLQMIGQGSSAALGMAQGFSGAAGNAIGGMSQQSQLGGVLGGAAAGAGAGAMLGPWGALAGGVVGGIGGYLGAG